MSKLENIHISRSALLLLGIQIFLYIIQLICFSDIKSHSFYEACSIIFIFTTLDFIIQVISLVLLSRLISIGGLFILVTYLVNLSYIVLIGLNTQNTNSSLIALYLSRYGQESFIQASIYALNVVCFVFLGYQAITMCSTRRFSPEVSDIETPRVGMSHLYWRVGIFASIFFGAVYFISTIYQVAFSFSHKSYVDLATITHSPLLSTAINLQPFFFASLYLLMMYYKLNNRLDISHKIFLFSIISLAISFLTGSRSRGMMTLLVLLVLWVKTINQIEPKKYVIYIFWGIVLLQLLYAIRSVRANDLSLQNYIDAFFSFNNSIFYETLNEFGASICATSGLMNVTSTIHPMDFFIKEIGSILPNVSSWGGALFQNPTTREGIEQLYHMGSTYVCDLYFYFGIGGQYLAVFLGILLATIDKYIESHNNSISYWKIVVAFPGIYTIFNSSRAPISLGIKMFVYSLVIFELLKTLLYSGSESEYSRNNVATNKRGAI